MEKISNMFPFFLRDSTTHFNAREKDTLFKVFSLGNHSSWSLLGRTTSFPLSWPKKFKPEASDHTVIREVTQYKCVAHLGLKWAECEWHFANDDQNRKIWSNFTTLLSRAEQSFLCLVYPSQSLYFQYRQVGTEAELLPWELFISLSQSSHCQSDGHMRVTSFIRILELQSTEIHFLA